MVADGLFANVLCLFESRNQNIPLGNAVPFLRHMHYAICTIRKKKKKLFIPIHIQWRIQNKCMRGCNIASSENLKPG